MTSLTCASTFRQVLLDYAIRSNSRGFEVLTLAARLDYLSKDSQLVFYLTCARQAL